MNRIKLLSKVFCLGLFPSFVSGCFHYDDTPLLVAQTCPPAPGACSPPKIVPTGPYRLPLQGGIIDVKFERESLLLSESFSGKLRQGDAVIDIIVQQQPKEPKIKVIAIKSDLGNFYGGPATLELTYKVSYGQGKDQTALIPINVELTL